MRKLRVYVSGPLTIGDQLINAREMAVNATEVYRAGFIPINPINPTWHMVTPLGYMEWIEIDLSLVEVADAVLRVTGVSCGADMETAHALTHGIPVFHSLSALLAGAPKILAGLVTGG
jgi:hypothetical protein